MILTTGRLRLRPLVRDDLDSLAALYADPQVMRFSLGLLDREQARRNAEMGPASPDLLGDGRPSFRNAHLIAAQCGSDTAHGQRGARDARGDGFARGSKY